MFRIDMLPANEGDALWIEYGPDGGDVHRVLIDCGRKTAYRAVADRLEEDPELALELFVLTHVDADHIAGAVPLLQDARFQPDRVGDVWFNGWRHLNGWHKDEDPGDQGPDVLGAKQGEFFAAVLRDRKYPWNEAFEGYPVVVPAAGDLPQRTLPGGMVLTLLSPTAEKMADMRERWIDDLGDITDPSKQIDPGDWKTALDVLSRDRAGAPDLLRHAPEGPIVVDELVAEPFNPDDSEPNGSSIAFLAEYDGKAVLFAGDAHAPVLVSSIKRLLEARGADKLELDAFKMSHHGSMRNNSEELIDLLACKRYLVSTDGARHNHPDREALARVLVLNSDGVEFAFNHRSEFSEAWDEDALKQAHGYSTVYPESGDGLRVEL